MKRYIDLYITEPISFSWEDLANYIAGDEIKSNYALQVGNYIISIAVGFGGYCTPRKSDLHLKEYSEVEIAIIDLKGNWINPRSLSKTASDVISLHFEDNNYPVAAYVDVNILPIWINLLLKEPSIYKKEEDPYEDGRYGKGGLGTHDYFSFSD